MDVTTCDDALLLPPRPGKRSTIPGERRAGAYDRSGQAVRSSILVRHGSLAGFFAQAADEPQLVGGEVVFGGPWCPNYGHFLLETLSRAWYLRARPDQPVCWLAREGKISDWQRELLALVEITNPVRVLDRPARVDRLLLPEPGFQIGGFFRPEQVAALAVRAGAAPVKGKFVWLSRSRLPDGRVLDEPAIEESLSPDWIIYHPQSHPIAEQLGMLADAERIAGFVGSAFHTLVLFADLRARIDLFCRSGDLNSNYRIIAEAKGLDQHVHQSAVTHVRGKGNGADFCIDDPTMPVRVLRG